jgi:hypothetical protein
MIEMTMIIKMVTMKISAVKILSMIVITTVLIANRVVSNLNFIPLKYNSVKSAAIPAKFDIIPQTICLA